MMKGRDMKAAVFFFTGLVLMLGVVGGIESTIDIDFGMALQFLGMTFCGVACMMIGISYFEEQ